MKIHVLPLAFLLIISSSLSSNAQNYLDPINTGNNAGKAGVAWRSNEAGSTNIDITSEGLKFTIHSKWDQYLDAAHPPAKAPALMVFFTKTAAGDVAIGFAPDTGWGESVKTSPQGLRLFKVKGTQIYVSRDF